MTRVLFVQERFAFMSMVFLFATPFLFFFLKSPFWIF